MRCSRVTAWRGLCLGAIVALSCEDAGSKAPAPSAGSSPDAAPRDTGDASTTGQTRLEEAGPAPGQTSIGGAGGRTAGARDAGAAQRDAGNQAASGGAGAGSDAGAGAAPASDLDAGHAGSVEIKSLQRCILMMLPPKPAGASEWIVSTIAVADSFDACVAAATLTKPPSFKEVISDIAEVREDPATMLITGRL